MESIVRTIYGNYIQTCKYLGVKPTLHENTTLNQKFNVLNGTALENNDYPVLRYFCIGMGGHKSVSGSDGIARNILVKHKATDSSLYKYLPFVCRPTDNDLTESERQDYALRVTEEIGGRNYYCYYLRRFSTSNINPVMEYNTVSGGTVRTESFVPKPANLNPVPSEETLGAQTVSGDYVNVVSRFTVGFNANQTKELLNAALIKYGDRSYAVISEIGLVTGVDKTVQVNTNSGGLVTMKEVIGAQISAFVSTKMEMQFSTKGANIELDVGAMEPLFATQ